MISLITSITEVDTAKRYTVGTIAQLKNGNEYIYLPGTPNVAKYNVCSFGSACAAMSYGSVALLNINEIGCVGIAQGAIIQNTWGWFQIKGLAWASCDAVLSAGTILFSSGTLGYLTNAKTAGDAIMGMINLATSAAGTVRVSLNYPFVSNTFIN